MSGTSERTLILSKCKEMGIPVKSGERTLVLRKNLADIGINDFHIEEPQQVEENNASDLLMLYI